MEAVQEGVPEGGRIPVEGFSEHEGEEQKQRGGGDEDDEEVVLEAMRGAGEGAEGEVLHRAPLRHHAPLLERLPLK